MSVWRKSYLTKEYNSDTVGKIVNLGLNQEVRHQDTASCKYRNRIKVLSSIITGNILCRLLQLFVIKADGIILPHRGKTGLCRLIKFTLRNHEQENLDLLYTMMTLDRPWTYDLLSVSARGTPYPWASRGVTSSW